MHHLKVTLGESGKSVQNPHGIGRLERRIYAAAGRFIEAAPKVLEFVMEYEWGPDLRREVHDRLEALLKQTLHDPPIRDKQGLEMEGTIDIHRLLSNEGWITGEITIGLQWNKHWGLEVEIIDDGKKQRPHEVVYHNVAEE